MKKAIVTIIAALLLATSLALATNSPASAHTGRKSGDCITSPYGSRLHHGGWGSGANRWCTMGRNGNRFVHEANNIKMVQAITSCVTDHYVDPDGDFGRQTESAVKTYQRSKGLHDDGIVGASTLRHLGWELKYEATIGRNHFFTAGTCGASWSINPNNGEYFLEYAAFAYNRDTGRWSIELT